ncbi:MAG: hypothetical protein ABFD82_22850 [Syntrophaceae bacterium]
MVEEKDTYEENHKDQTEKIVGSFLPRILHLENLMKDIMSRHFCSEGDEKGSFFFYSSLPHISFSKKINTFITVLKTSYNDIYTMFESDLQKLYEIDECRRYLENLLLNDNVNVLSNKVVDNIQKQQFKSGKSIFGETLKKEHTNKVRLCAKITTTLKIIQRDIIIRGYHD